MASHVGRVQHVSDMYVWMKHLKSIASSAVALTSSRCLVFEWVKMLLWNAVELSYKLLIQRGGVLASIQ